MSATIASEFFRKGMEALDHGHLYLARFCFKWAVTEERSPNHCSYLALSIASTRGEAMEAVSLAEEAVAAEPDNPLHYLRLGRVCLLVGDKTRAMEVFRTGARFGGHPEIIRELEALGSRKPAVFRQLPRNHPANRYLGLILSRLGLR